MEGHGTGTYLGDPLEVEALNRIYYRNNPARGYCALGSVKSNVGHLEVAAGVASLIKAILSIKHARIAPTCHFNSPNPRIDFASTPFFVNKTAIDWPQGFSPRRAAVSSFGVGGTNAHLILEEAPQRESSRSAGAAANPLMVVSARSEKALKELAGRYGEFLAGQDADGLDLADFCHTTQEGREHHAVRLAVVGESLEELRSGLDAAMTHEEWTATNTGDEHRPVFLFTGQGAQRSGMGKELYQAQPCFRAELDRCARLFDPLLP